MFACVAQIGCVFLGYIQASRNIMDKVFTHIYNSPSPLIGRAVYCMFFFFFINKNGRDCDRYFWRHYWTAMG
jgi:hypothetical protein